MCKKELMFQVVYLLGIVTVIALAGCTVIRDSHVDLTQAGVINRSADGGSGANEILNKTSGGMDAEVPVSALP